MAFKAYKQLENRLKSSMISVGSVKGEATDLINRGDELANLVKNGRATLQEIAEFGEIVKKMNRLLKFARLEDDELKELEEGYGNL